ncbi:MAG TPA: 6-carboxytetrahydropterin synthase [Gemmatimonadales bacterium]|jgi:6-pyruvoyltetrahydropterin/6-carboxytetrahydropterin synthase
MATRLTRMVRFHADHRYWMPEWSAERNLEIFGKLTEPHPHHYVCAVTVEGQVDSRTGMVLDLPLLDRILADEVLTPLDHKDLNRDIPAFRNGGQLPTCEALAAWLFGRIAARLPTGVRLERVRVEEDPTLYAECTGPA